MSSARRVTDWSSKSAAQWRELVTRDLDQLDDDIQEAVRGLRSDMGDLKEQQKWMLRTMWALLVSVLLVVASIMTAVVIP